MKIIIQLFLIGIGLSMDAFAVSVCKGLGMPRINKKHCALIAVYFGGFQALMPFLGWMLGKQFEVYITSVDHWIAFILLAVIGGKMCAESFKEEEEIEVMERTLDLKELFFLALATSIDALAVGITFAFLETPIIEACAIIGVTTFLFSVTGVYFGHRFGNKYKNKAELAGGLILILIGMKILLEHMGII